MTIYDLSEIRIKRRDQASPQTFFSRKWPDLAGIARNRPEPECQTRELTVAADPASSDSSFELKTQNPKPKTVRTHAPMSKSDCHPRGPEGRDSKRDPWSRIGR